MPPFFDEIFYYIAISLFEIKKFLKACYVLVL